MKEYGLKLEELKRHLDEKKIKKYRVQIFINLCNKLDEDVDNDIKELIKESYDLLNELYRDDDLKPKEYIKSFANLQKVVKDKLGFTAKDEIKTQYIGIGIAIGVAMGAPFSAINPAFMGIGLPIGLAIGAGIGEKKEKEAIQQGKVY